jgi:hypothetical protein
MDHGSVIIYYFDALESQIDTNIMLRTAEMFCKVYVTLLHFFIGLPL